MSAALEHVARLREERAAHVGELARLEPAWRDALERALQHHGLREVARHAGLSHTGVKYVVSRKETPQ